MKQPILLSNDTISGLCRGLSLLLHAGVGVGDGLALLAQEEESPALRAVLDEMARQMDDGSPLAAALRSSGRFPNYVCGLVEVGERSGRTEEALAALARHYEDRGRLERRLRSALLYPAVLLVVMLAVIVVLLARVLPVFNEIYADLGGRLTGVAGGLLTLGRVLDQAMPVLCVLLVLVVLFLALFAALPAFRGRVLALWRKSRGAGPGRRHAGRIQLYQPGRGVCHGGNREHCPAEYLSLHGGVAGGLPLSAAHFGLCAGGNRGRGAPPPFRVPRGPAGQAPWPPAVAVAAAPSATNV